MADTLLVIDPIDLPPFSARGLTQTLEHIEQASQVRRTVNGTMRDISAPQFQKYKSTINCTDQQTPLPDDLFPGMLVVVDCVAELWYGPSGSPARPVVSGSTRLESDRIFYRPRLNMLVVSYTTNRDEYGATTGWTLELQEE